MTVPRCLTIEGPPGVGKTTLCKAIVAEAERHGQRWQLADEFTESPIGRYLSEISQFGAAQDDAMIGFHRILGHLADKTHWFQKARDVGGTWVFDRFVTTQLVTGLSMIDHSQDRSVARDLIVQLERWAESVFDDASLRIFLRAPLSCLRTRLECRLGRPLTAEELGRLEREIKRYAELRDAEYRWEVAVLDSREPVTDLVAEIREAFL